MGITIFFDDRFFSLDDESASEINPEDCQNQFKKFLENDEQSSFSCNCVDSVACLEKIKQMVITRSAAGGIVVNSEGKLLMITRFGIPDLPKGHIEEGESAEEAALREVQEECGIFPDKIEKKLPTSYHIFKEKNRFILKEVFWFQMRYNKQEELIPQTKESISRAAWYEKNEIEIIIKKTYQNLKAYLDYFLTKRW